MSREARREYDRNWYAGLSAQQKRHKVKTQAVRQKKIREEIRRYKQEHPCACGESHPACLDFHHLTKDKQINIADAKGWGLARIMKEIKKCTVICANCHRKLHDTVS